MYWQNSPYTLILLLSAGIAGFIAFFAFRRRTATGALPFSLAMASIALWMLGYTIRWAGADAATQLIGIRIVYLGIAIESVTLLVFAFQYTGKNHWITRGNLLLLSIVPAITLALIWTNDWHGLFWRRTWLEMVNGMAILRWERGLWSLVNALYSYVLGMVTFALILLAFVRAPRLYRAQAGAVLLGGILFWVAALINSVSTTLADQDRIISFFPIITSLFGLSMLFGIFGFRMFDIVPIARSILVDGLDDGVMVLDLQKRIVDVNPSVQRLFGVTATEMIGQTASNALHDYPALLGLLDSPMPARMEMRLRDETTFMDYDVHVSLLTDRKGKPIGQSIAFRELTELKQAQVELLQQQRAVAILQERERLAHELHDSLGQVLGYVNVQAQAIRTLLGQGKVGEAQTHLSRLADVARDAQVDVREYIFSAKTGIQAGQGLIPALRYYLSRFSQNYGIPTFLEAPEETGIFSPVVEAHVLRLVQEALNNVRKHAQAREALVSICPGDDYVDITVTDDGVGFDADALSPDQERHFGVRIMRERAGEIASLLDIQSAPGKGTRVSLRVPRK